MGDLFMTQVEKDSILLAVARCPAAMEALPEEVVDKLTRFRERDEERIRKEVEREKIRRAEEEAWKRQRAEEERKEMDELLCTGTWAENIPRRRRFALCAAKVYSAENQTYEEWYCAIDLVRGFKSPYFGYYSDPHLFYIYRIKPVLEATTKNDLRKELRVNWNFFSIKNHDLGKKFSILEYEVYKSEMGAEEERVRVVSRSEEKTWEEHLVDLKKEFGGDDA